MSRSLEHLECLTILAERLAHALRTPLSIPLGVLNDLSRGYHLKNDELEDGKQALLKIVGMLETVAELSAVGPMRSWKESNPVPISEIISPIISELNSELLLVESPVELRVNTAGSPVECAFRAALRYAGSYIRRFAEPNGPKPTISYRGNGDSGVRITATGENVFQLSERGEVMELIRNDHSMDGLNLIFANVAFNAGGARLQAGWQSESGLVLDVCF